MDGEQLKQVLTDHSLWLSSNGKQGKRAGLHRANLTGANLSGADLTRANLTGADLFGADLTGAQFELEIVTAATFWSAQVAEEQLAWLCLHPRFGEWRDGLKIVS